MNTNRGYIIVDLESFKEFKRGSIERELLLELSYRENRERLNNKLPKGHFYINQVELSKELNVSQMTISRGLKKLVKNGCITEVEKSKKRGVPSIYGLVCVIQQQEMFKVDTKDNKKTQTPVKPKVLYLKPKKQLFNKKSVK